MSKYVSKQSPVHTVHLLDGVFTADGGVLDLSNEDEKYAKELERLMASGKRPDLVQAFAKIDEAAARRIVEAHRKSLRPTANTGPVASTQTPEHAARTRNVQDQLATDPNVEKREGVHIPLQTGQPPAATVSAEEKLASTHILGLGKADEDGKPPPAPPGTPNAPEKHKPSVLDNLSKK